MTAKLDGEIYTWTRNRNSMKASRSTIQPRNICRKAEAMAAADHMELPIVSYQSAARVWEKEGVCGDCNLVFGTEITKSIKGWY